MGNRVVGRIQSIDLLRGLVMIIMALDHTRDFFHYGVSIDQDPLNFATTTPILFLTRWITHFCAPVFVFLSGTSIYLYASKGRTKKEVSFFLLTRGLWLIFAEIFIIGPIFDFQFTQIFLQVIWAIGISMVFMSFLLFLPYRVLLLIGLMIVFGHNLLDGIKVENPTWLSVIWAMIHRTRLYNVTDHFIFVTAYPFLSWLGTMILGYCLGKLFMPSVDSGYRKKWLRNLGWGAILLFIVLRFINIYGDSQHWAVQKTTIFTMLDFVNTTKYPPSLLYLLMTLGPALLFLSVAEKFNGPVPDFIKVYGKVPFFYYILHFFLIHILRWLFFFLGGHHFSEMVFDAFRIGNIPFGNGYPLWVVYPVWLSVVLILYYPCRWYGQYKSSHHNRWLSYL